MVNDSLDKEIFEKVAEAIAKSKGIARKTISPDSSFEQLKMDSLDGLNLFFELEIVFDLTIPDERARALRSVEEVVKEIKVLLSEQGTRKPGKDDEGLNV